MTGFADSTREEATKGIETLSGLLKPWQGTQPLTSALQLKATGTSGAERGSMSPTAAAAGAASSRKAGDEVPGGEDDDVSSDTVFSTFTADSMLEEKKVAHGRRVRRQMQAPQLSESLREQQSWLRSSEEGQQMWKHRQGLPSAAMREEVLRLVEEHQVVVVTGGCWQPRGGQTAIDVRTRVVCLPEGPIILVLC
jgi:hypothetical protein